MYDAKTVRAYRARRAKTCHILMRASVIGGLSFLLVFVLLYGVSALALAGWPVLLALAVVYSGLLMSPDAFNKDEFRVCADVFFTNGFSIDRDARKDDLGERYAADIRSLRIGAEAEGNTISLKTRFNDVVWFYFPPRTQLEHEFAEFLIRHAGELRSTEGYAEVERLLSTGEVA